MEFEKALPSFFLLLTHIASWDAQSVAAEADLTKAPAWLLFEACAQASAMHQRLVTNFRDHSFLLSVGSVPLDTPAVSGTCHITCRIEGCSDRAAIYTADVFAEKEILRAEGIIIGHVPYGDAFDGRRLAAHYREIAQWLTR